MKDFFTKENIEKISSLCRKYPNDMELGNIVRKEFSLYKFPLHLGNDQELGKETRKYFHNFLDEKK
jgi:hypothetical protein